MSSNYREKKLYGNRNFKFTSLKERKKKTLYKQILCQKNIVQHTQILIDLWKIVQFK